jgi:YidC/Oxa1 family membrane protein insertase
VQARLALALLLSFLVLVFMRGGEPPATSDGADEALAPADGGSSDEGSDATSAGDVPDASAEVLAQAEPWRETFMFGPYEATFDNAGAVLCELRLDGFYTELFLDEEAKADPTYWVALCEEIDTGKVKLSSLALSAQPSSMGWSRLDPATARWEVEVKRSEGGEVNAVTFTLDGGEGVVFEKSIRLADTGYDLEVDVAIRNEGAAALADIQGAWRLTPAMGVPRAANDNFYVEPKADVCWRKSKGKYGIKREERNYSKRDDGAFPPSANIVWAGVDNKYFVMALRPADPEASATLVGASWRTVWDAEWAHEWLAENPNSGTPEGYRVIATDLDLIMRMPALGAEVRYPFRLYAGPKDKGVLAKHPDGEALIQLVSKDLGFFSGIAALLTSILGFLHGIVGNWGVAIILLTLLVRTVLFPFNRRSQTAMARHATKMKRIQPRLNELKEKYAKDPRKQREEQARIMQEEGAFPPLGGCLPIFLQIPVFFGLFSALRTSFDLRQAPFLGWIHDLSEPDRFMYLGLNVPLLDLEYLNILPPLMVVLWILQQKVMPKPTDEQALRMQKMMMWMPILFGFFLYNYAAGLSLYMITTSIFGILEQTVIKKIWPIDDREMPKKKGGFMNRLAKMQEQAKSLEEMKRRAKTQQHQQRQRRDKGKGKGGLGSKGKKSH